MQVPHEQGMTKLKDAMWITAEPLYKQVQVEFENLNRMFMSDFRQISPFDYYSGIKKQENWRNENQNLIILDIDSGLSIEDAKKEFGQYTYFMYTTKSHQVDKKGVTCDRYRIVLPAVSIPTGDVYFEYMRTLEAVYPFIDTQVNNKTGAFLGNADGEYWYNNGELFSLANFRPITKVSAPVSKQYRQVEPRHDLPIDQIKQSLDQETVSQIVESCGFEVNRNFKFKFRADERTPSASISKDGLVKDFGSDLSTDIIGFVQETKGLDFKDAVGYVASFINISFGGAA